MPPAIPDEGSSSEVEVATRSSSGKEKMKQVEVEVEEDEEDEEEEVEEDPDEFVVEKIVSHAFEDDGTIKYEVKWLGYEKKSDRTWEPEENLATAQDTLEAYFTKIGGRPAFKTPAPKAGRGPGKRKQSEPAASTPASTPGAGTGTGRGRGRKKIKTEDSRPPSPKKKQKVFPAGSWEDDVVSIDTIEETVDPSTGSKERYVYLEWKDGTKTQHKLKAANQKCPQKLLAYYEQHLTFKTFDTPETAKGVTKGAANGDEENGTLFP